MIIYKAYKARLYPNLQQQQTMLQFCGSTRFVWNYYLAKRKEAYEKEKKTLSGYDCTKDLTQLKKQEGYEWLKNSPAEALQKSILDLDVAYKNFFREVKKGKKCYPKFKSKHKAKPSFYDSMCFKLSGNHLQVSKKHSLTMRFRGIFLPESAIPQSITISQDIDKKWFVSILTKEEIFPEAKIGEPIGVDVGLTHLAITSKGEKIDAFRPKQRLAKKMKKIQQSLAKKQKGGVNRQKAKKIFTILNKKIRNQRMDYLHKASHRITGENQAVIVCEDLSIKNIMKNHKMANSFGDSGIAEFIRQLEYKQIWKGGHFKKVDKFFPSSKLCSNCGYLVDKLPLEIREWKCPKCGILHDRDINAAKNLAMQAGDLLPRVEEKDGIAARQKSNLTYEARKHLNLSLYKKPEGKNQNRVIVDGAIGLLNQENDSL